MTASVRPQPKASMAGRQLPQAQTRLVARRRVLLCDAAIPVGRSGSLAVVSRAETGLALQQRDYRSG